MTGANSDYIPMSQLMQRDRAPKDAADGATVIDEIVARDADHGPHFALAIDDADEADPVMPQPVAAESAGEANDPSPAVAASSPPEASVDAATAAEPDASGPTDISAQPALSAFDPDVLLAARRAVSARFDALVQDTAATIIKSTSGVVGFHELALAVAYALSDSDHMRSRQAPTAAEIAAALQPAIETGAVIQIGDRYASTPFATIGVRERILLQFAPNPDAPSSAGNDWCTSEALTTAILEDAGIPSDDPCAPALRDRIDTTLQEMLALGELASLSFKGKCFLRPQVADALADLGADGLIFDVRSGEILQ